MRMLKADELKMLYGFSLLVVLAVLAIIVAVEKRATSDTAMGYER